MNTLALIFVNIIVVTRGLVGVAFLVSVLVALTHWAVREGKLEPFGGWPTFVRKWSDPPLRKIEDRLNRAGGNPQHAPFWLMGVAVVGGLVLIELLGFIFGFILRMGFAAQSGASSLAWILTDLAFQVMIFAILVRVFSSWFGGTRHTKWIRWSYQLTDWLVNPISRVLPPIGMIDLSPFVAWFLLSLLRGVVLS
jgi:YggT family protein